MCEMINKTGYMSVDHNIQVPLLKLIKSEFTEKNENGSNLV